MAEIRHIAGRAWTRIVEFRRAFGGGDAVILLRAVLAQPKISLNPEMIPK